ncbi:MAG: hypothetical protein E6R13_06020 [Spirochaetes bacterium]|jgi:hypothetical protein|nr:MAG: hypothetical protein E6R13_06020 [Spirochaetota bacterium]
MPKLLGNRIYLEMPKKEESKLIVDENTKEALQKELLKKMSRLKVHSVGTAITDPDLKVGVEVLVDPSALRDKTLIIPLSENEEVMLVSIFDIVHIW